MYVHRLSLFAISYHFFPPPIQVHFQSDLLKSRTWIVFFFSVCHLSLSRNDIWRKKVKRVIGTIKNKIVQKIWSDVQVNQAPNRNNIKTDIEYEEILK